MFQKSDLPNHLLDGAKTRTVNIGISTTCPSTGERHAGVVNLGDCLSILGVEVGILICAIGSKLPIVSL